MIKPRPIKFGRFGKPLPVRARDGRSYRSFIDYRMNLQAPGLRIFFVPACGPCRLSRLSRRAVVICSGMQS